MLQGDFVSASHAAAQRHADALIVQMTVYFVLPNAVKLQATVMGKDTIVATKEKVTELMDRQGLFQFSLVFVFPADIYILIVVE